MRKSKCKVITLLNLLSVLLLSGCSKNTNVNPDIISFRDTSDNLLMSGEVVKYAKADTDADGQPCITLKIIDTKKLYKVTDEVSKKDDNRIVIWYKYDAEKNSFESSESDCGNLEKPACLSVATVTQGFDDDEILITGGSFDKDEVNKIVKLINE